MMFEVGSTYRTNQRGRLWLCLDSGSFPLLCSAVQLNYADSFSLRSLRLRIESSLSLASIQRDLEAASQLHYDPIELPEDGIEEIGRVERPSQDEILYNLMMNFQGEFCLQQPMSVFTWASTVTPALWGVVPLPQPKLRMNRIRGVETGKMLKTWGVSKDEFDEVVETLFDPYRYRSAAVERVTDLNPRHRLINPDFGA